MYERIKDRILLLLFLLLALVGYLVVTFTKPAAANERSLSGILQSQPAGEIISLTELTDFEWDSAYTFRPYTDKEKICQVMGFETAESLETVNESMVQMIFTKEKEVVCVLLGYPEKLGYFFDYGVEDYKYLIFSASNEPKFRVERPYHHYLVFRYVP